MTHSANFLGLDLGASNGRAVLGQFDGKRLQLKEVHRFPNGPYQVLGNLHWDALGLLSHVKQGIAAGARACDGDLASAGLDTWGVDFGLLDANDELLGNPYHYRDSRTDGMFEEAFKRVPKEEIFQQTGIQFLQLNSLFQLLAMVMQGSPALPAAQAFLNVPDLFNFWLTGVKANEFTIATTSQCYNPTTNDWAWPILEALGIPTRMFGRIVETGTEIGPLHPTVQEETGAGPLPVIAVACHDTGSAAAAVPAIGDDHVFISSGTWSIMGVMLNEPMITPKTLAYNFTNEGGADHTFRLMKNIMGLWLVQECRREWAEAGEALSWDELTDLARQADAFGPLINPDDRLFLSPGNMPQRIQSYCADSGQAVPQSKGAILRCALESLALTYRRLMDQLVDVMRREYHTIHIIGGGSKNGLLNQLTADATSKPVVAGPVEATAIGNILVQAVATGHLASLTEGSELVRRSFPVTNYEPSHPAAWDDAYETYLGLVERS